MLKLSTQSALTLILQGSMGRFRVSNETTNSESLELRYLQTHVGFDFEDSASNEVLLDSMQPVRELFDFKMLNFNEIMQRDIDDARVSKDLIPYILDEHSQGSVKLFPPLIVVALPTESQGTRPAGLYPKIETTVQPDVAGNGYEMHSIRSGPLGQETFEFEFPVQANKTFYHDLVKLKLNPNRTKLVIIDGQHRAMALLALYRNIKNGGWSDARRKPYEDFYSLWTPSRIGAFSLKEIQLPVMICTYPQLDVTYQGSMDIIKAARATFLTLNKTAKRVSESRNRLLNDKDLVAVFLRQTLGLVKSRDSSSTSAFRIWNVELDQSADKQKLESPVACTGVSHVYYVIEHLLLSVDEDLKGVTARSGKFHKRTKNPELRSRLNATDILGADKAQTLQRDVFSEDSADALWEVFEERYGAYILGTFDTFAPYSIHNTATLNISKALEGNANPQISNILFDQQGTGRTFNAHRENLQQISPVTPELQSVMTRLEGTAKAVDNILQQLYSARAEAYLAQMPDRSKLRQDKVVSKLVATVIKRLYDEVFSTVAFQAALVDGFFHILERAERKAAQSGIGLMSRDDAFTEYIQQLNAYFVPATAEKFKKLSAVMFFGLQEKENSPGEFEMVPSNSTFRSVVYQGEMKPDEWPRYRYLFLELWTPSDPTIANIVVADRAFCRSQLLKSLRVRRQEAFCEANNKAEATLSSTEKEAIKTECLESFITFLRNLGLTGLKAAMFKDAFDDANVPLPSDIGEPEESLEVKAVAEELANAEAESDGGIESIEAAE